MAAKVIDGLEAAAEIRRSVAMGAERFSKDHRRPPCLAVILVGDDPASQVYVKMKEKAAAEVGIRSIKHTLPETTKQPDLISLIKKLGDDEDVHGILVQLPLPSHISERRVIEAVKPEKDVDGFHPLNAWLLMTGDDAAFRPCTPLGIMHLIRREHIEVEGKEAVIVGRSLIVGKPLSLMLLNEHATVTVCHSRTEDLEAVCRRADLLVVAAGKPGLIGENHVKPGAAVIDVGVNRLPEGGLSGDVAFDDVRKVAGYITPVPGGVGPMTIAMLMKNTLQAALRQVDR